MRVQKRNKSSCLVMANQKLKDVIMPDKLVENLKKHRFEMRIDAITPSVDL